MIRNPPSTAPTPDGMLLAGHFVAVPEPIEGPGLPRAERPATASDCLTDRLPHDGCWFDTAQEALAACLPLRVPAAARLYALLVPADHAGDFVGDILAAGTDEPVLLANLDGRAGTLAREAAEGGHELGWEVLGYDHGLLHSRLLEIDPDDVA
ncbi:hypothetical protein [Kitasatospora fiedleri]|uniref:hypothetical protein n=1 Tax=Kitasatospora fiedleri TaxID=2991545 RepID=UPI00249BF4A7|nr:hypothetical protein [Kitasatospora fiedleri]